MLYGTILIGAGSVALLSSLTMRWFFVIPVANYGGQPVGQGNLMPDPFSAPLNYLKFWSFLVFNLSEDQAGVDDGKGDFGFYSSADWGSYKWGGTPPSISGQTPDQFGATYGPLGAYAGFVSLGAIALGAVLNVVL